MKISKFTSKVIPIVMSYLFIAMISHSTKLIKIGLYLQENETP